MRLFRKAFFWVDEIDREKYVAPEVFDLRYHVGLAIFSVGFCSPIYCSMFSINFRVYI